MEPRFRGWAGRQVCYNSGRGRGLKSLRENLVSPYAKARKGFARLARPRYAFATRISCTLPYPTSACAAFIKESRIKSANAIRLHRKFGGTWGTLTAWCWEQRDAMGLLSCT